MGCDSQFDDTRSILPYPKSLVKEKGPRIQTTAFPSTAYEKGCVDVVSFGDPVSQPGQFVPEEKPQDPLNPYRPPLTEFEQELRHLLNRYSMENASNTPDSILAEYLHSCLRSFNLATTQRERWYGRKVF